MEVNAADVKKLRDRTGMQMMKCKAALIEAGGDMDKATEILRKQNKDVSAKVADRETAEGRVGIYIDPVKKIGAIVELRCESAPVAKNEMFVKLANDVAKQIATHGPGPVDTLLAQPFVDEPAKTLGDRIQEIVGLMRENVKLQRMARLEGLLGHYVHHDGTVGVLVACEGTQADGTILRDVSMHVAAKTPIAAFREEISPEVIAKEREIALAQAQEQGKGKAANIIEKIADGKLAAWFKEQVLAEQLFVKDESKTIGDLLKGAGLTLKKFVRYRVGEVTA